MPGLLRSTIAIFTSRDELSFRNIRGSLWAAFLVFPLSYIVCDMRFFGIETSILGLQTFELLTFALGFGWFVPFFLPKAWIIPALRVSAVVCAVILPFQMILPDGLHLLFMLLFFQFFIGICLGTSFYIFCFTLNNIERLIGMCLVSFYFGIFYYVLFNIPAFVAFMRTWGSAMTMVLYLVVVFYSYRKEDQQHRSGPDNNNYQHPVFLMTILVVICHLMWYTINYTLLDENASSLVFGLAAPAAIVLICIMYFSMNAGTLHIWLLSLVFFLLGASLLLFDSLFAVNAGSFFYGLGDKAGFIIVYFMCGGAIKQCKSYKMYRIFCLMLFVIHAVLNGLLIYINNYFIGMSHIVGFGIILTLCCLCFSMLPYLQNRIFNAPWTDGLKLADMPEYKSALSELEELDKIDNLGLSPREKEIFLLLLGDSQRKHIAHTLKVGEGTINFHVNNLYRKLGIQSRAELFAKYHKYAKI